MDRDTATYFGLLGSGDLHRARGIPKFFEVEPITITMEVPLALDIQPMDQIRYGAGHCLVCGRKLEGEVSYLWGARWVRSWWPRPSSGGALTGSGG